MSSIGLQRGTVQLIEYDPEWTFFNQEKELPLKTFGQRIIAIEHVGSTAVPGLPAKPIIDIIAAVESLADIDDFIAKLPELGYEYMPERSYADRHFYFLIRQPRIRSPEKLGTTPSGDECENSLKRIFCYRQPWADNSGAKGNPASA